MTKERTSERALALRMAALVLALMLAGALLTSSLVAPAQESPSAEDVPEFEPQPSDATDAGPIDLARVPREGETPTGD